MRQSKAYIYLLIVFLVTSCGSFSRISVGEVRDLNVKGFENNAVLASVRVSVENPTSHKITVTDIDLKVYMNNQYIGRVNFIEQLVLPAKSDYVYNIDLNIHVANFFGAAMTLMNLKNGQIINFKMEGTIGARSMLIKKNFKIIEERKVVI